ncbi:MAG: hypothetical protein AB7W06_17325 [Alphaproteobacteria bacterium]
MRPKHIAAVLPTLWHELVEAELIAAVAKAADIDELIISDALDVLGLKGVITFRPPLAGEPPGKARLRFACSLAELADQVLCVVLDEWIWVDSEDNEDEFVHGEGVVFDENP